MKRLTTMQKRIANVVGLGHVWERKNLILMLAGYEKRRWKQFEYNLPRTVKKGLIREKWYKEEYAEGRFKGKKIYTKDRNFNNIEHGLACTEALTRLYLANPEGELVAENYFKGEAFKNNRLNCIPEWGIHYPENKTLLLYEHCTTDNVKRGEVTRKVNAYKRNLSKIEEHFDAAATLVFTLDIDRKEVVKEAEKHDRYFFTDWQTFIAVPLYQQLTAPVYIWAGDGKEYGLRR